MVLELDEAKRIIRERIESGEVNEMGSTDLIAKAYGMIVKEKPELRKDKAFQTAWGKVVDWATMNESEMNEGAREAEELELYIVNDGETYRTMKVSQLSKDLQSGKLSGDAAKRAFMKVVEYGVKRYYKEFPDDHPNFSKSDKGATVQGLITYYSEP